MIDHTLLNSDAKSQDIERVCNEAMQYSFFSVCVNSSQIARVTQLLASSSVKPICVVGFPLGTGSTEAKAYECQKAIEEGAQEIDMVMNVGALKDKDYRFVFQDIEKVVLTARAIPVKVILETASLEREEIIASCTLAKAAQAAFVKTSTGFGKGGATEEAVRLMRETVGSQMGVKASGGIRTFEDAIQMIEAGATRIGASASVAIVTHEKSDFSGY